MCVRGQEWDGGEEWGFREAEKCTRKYSNRKHKSVTEIVEQATMSFEDLKSIDPFPALTPRRGPNIPPSRCVR